MDAPRTPLAQARCYNHPAREAVAICTVTGNPFCRECIVEHEGKMVSAEIVAQCLPVAEEAKSSWRGAALRALLSALALLLLAYGFYLLGRILLAMPNRFHEGVLW